MDDDVFFEMDFGDGRGYRRITADQVERLGPNIEKAMEKELQRAGEKLEGLLREKYLVSIGERPRVDGAESLRDRVMAAIYAHVDRQSGGFTLGVFDNQIAEAEYPSDNVKGDRSLFELLEEGYDGSKAHGFVPLDDALSLADECANDLDLPDSARANLKGHVAEAFQGKHGEGIMVDVFNEPLFFAYPEFGTAFEHGYLPHAGWEGWGVLADPSVLPDERTKYGSQWIDDLFKRSVTNAAVKLGI
jgi:hypothetical protein